MRFFSGQMEKFGNLTGVKYLTYSKSANEVFVNIKNFIFHFGTENREGQITHCIFTSHVGVTSFRYFCQEGVHNEFVNMNQPS